MTAPERIWAASVTENYGEWQTTTDGLPRPTEYVRADIDTARIAALEAQLAERVKVKVNPLEWTELSTGWIAHTSFHAYEVVKTDHGFMATYANRDFAWGAEDAMKAAAQADYERRILSDLEATPPAPKDSEPTRVYEPYPGAFDGILGSDTPLVPKVTDALTIAHEALEAASDQILESYRTWVADDKDAKPRYGQYPRYDQVNAAIRVVSEALTAAQEAGQ